MKNNNGSYNYDELIKNNLSNWKPDVPDSQIEHDWNKLSDSLTPPSAPASSGGIENLITTFKSNLGSWLFGTALIVSTASIITYFVLLPAENETVPLSENNETILSKTDDSDPEFNNENLQAEKSDTETDHLIDHKEAQENSVINKRSDNKQKTEKSNKSFESNLISTLDVPAVNFETLEGSNNKQIEQILSDGKISQNEIKVDEEKQISEDKVITLPDSIVCHEHIDQNSNYSQAGTYLLNYSITEDQQIQKIERNLIVLPPVKAAFEIIEKQLPEIRFVNLSENAEHYKWKIANEHYYINNPTIIISETGKYNFILTAYNELGCSDTYELTFHFLNDNNLTIPNVFTPDGDGVNDEFVIDITGEDYFHLSILNSEGQTVFQSNDKTNVWDGLNINTGEKCPSGNYYYVFRYRFLGETDINTKTGMLYLIRKNH